MTTTDTIIDPADQPRIDAIAVFDGASRGNPGAAARGGALLIGGDEVDSFSQQLSGERTNNQAEYRAAEGAVRLAAQHDIDHLVLRGDSQLVVEQLRGNYAVNDDTLATLHERVIDLLDAFDTVSIQHVPREENERADALANAAFDDTSIDQPATRSSH